MLDFGFYNMDGLCGMKQFPDKFFDIAVVDPPYGGVTQGGYMSNQMGGGVAKNRNDYHLSLWQCEKPKPEYYKELFRVSKQQVIWGGNYFTNNLPESQCWLVWDKNKPEGVGFADFEMAWTSYDLSSKMFRFTWNGMLQGDMKNKEYKIHPTQKPVALYNWIFNKFDIKPGMKFLDTHVGSASSLISAHDNGINYVGFEIDKTYYHMAKERLEQETAQTSIFDFGVERK